MLRFNRNLFNMAKFFSSGKVGPNDLKVSQIKGDQQLKDKVHIQNIDQQSLNTLPEHTKNRKTFSIYNLCKHLPIRFLNSLAKLTSDSNTALRSQDLYLPRLTENGVPVYDSIFNSKSILLIKSAQIFVPFLYITSVNFYFIMLINSLLFFKLYKGSYFKLAQNFVVKMQLVPQTQQLLVQKIGNFGQIRTKRVKISDLQHVDYFTLDEQFYRSTRSFINKKIIFKIKSTQELLMFDHEGLWYEEGLNHQLLV